MYNFYIHHSSQAAAEGSNQLGGESGKFIQSRGRGQGVVDTHDTWGRESFSRLL